MTGTFVNTATIMAGSLIGMAIRSKLPRKYVDTVFQVIGLFTLALGISMSLKSDAYLLIVISIVAGSLIGVLLRIDLRVERLSGYLQTHSGKKENSQRELPEDVAPIETAPQTRFTEGFITGSMLFCVGSMSILGAIEDGMGEAPVLLYTKSIMDGVSSVILASSFGIAIFFPPSRCLYTRGL